MRRLTLLVGALLVSLWVASPAAADPKPQLVPQPVPAPEAQVQPQGEITIMATRDGVWNGGEFALWKHSNFTLPIYDTTDDEVGTYNDRYFVNTSQRLNDEASSTGNAFSDRAIRAYQHSGFDGPSVYHNRYGSCPTPTCYAYSALGWANDNLSSHVHAG